MTVLEYEGRFQDLLVFATIYLPTKLHLVERFQDLLVFVTIYLPTELYLVERFMIDLGRN
jgi:hypothetical protein